MPYSTYYTLTTPRTHNNPHHIFEFVVNKLIHRMNATYPLSNEFRTHNQWANLIFGTASANNSTYLSRVTGSYNNYLVRSRNKYKWDFESIYNDHRGFFEREPEVPVEELVRNNLVGMAKAIDDEIIQSQRERQSNTYKVRKLEHFKISNQEQVYTAILDVEQDGPPKLKEGLPFKIKIGGLSFDAKVLDFDLLESKLYFDTNYALLGYEGSIRIELDSSWLLEHVRHRLDGIDPDLIDDYPLMKFLSREVEPDELYDLNAGYDPDTISLDDSQQEAFEFAVENDITLIWGPPGTGKSHTLSHVLDDFYQKKEKTLVCCIANVAVDALAKKFASLIEQVYAPEEFSNGSVLRIGHTKDLDLIKKDYLFPTNESITTLRNNIKVLRERLQKVQDKKEEVRVGILKELDELETRLKESIELLINDAKVIFSTASKAHSDKNIYEKKFDNLVIDEASMMSIPHFVALAKNITKRIIVTGDFRQLGPIVLSQTSSAQKWLKKDVFQFAGVKTRATNIDHPALLPLLVQRRSHEKICELINQPFYNGKLISKSVFKSEEIIAASPQSGMVVSLVDLSEDEEFKVERTGRGSRYNKVSALKVIELVKEYLENDSSYSLGIITPYQGQVRLIEGLLDELAIDAEQRSLIRIGTIHAFQGSECDIVLFDLVDSSHERIGRLYQHNQGERLFNVALSRAKSKLIIVGDLEVFYSGQGHNNIEGTILRIGNKLRKMAGEEVMF